MCMFVYNWIKSSDSSSSSREVRAPLMSGPPRLDGSCRGAHGIGPKKAQGDIIKES